MNTPRHVESILGDGSESQGCGQGINDPGARPGPISAPRLLTQVPCPPIPGAGSGVGQTHPGRPEPLPAHCPTSGETGLSLHILLKKGKLPVCEEKSPPNSSTALGHQSVLTKQHPNGLSISESGTYGSHLP